MKNTFLILCVLLLSAWGGGVRAQTDYSYLINTGVWSSDGTYNHYLAHEKFSETAYSESDGRILYQTIGGLPAGTYQVTFYAVASSTSNRDDITNDAYGDGITVSCARVIKNEEEEAMKNM